MTYNDGFTTGDLSPLIVVSEGTYGITPTSGWAFGLETKKITIADSINQYKERWGGDRSINAAAMVSQGLDAGFDIEFDLPQKTGWINPVIAAALGSSAGTDKTGDLLSFSAIVEVASSANRLLYNGCKVDSLKMSCSKPKGVVNCSASFLARYRASLSGASITGLQNRTFSDIPVVATRTVYPPVQWVKAMTLNGTTIYPQSFDIEVKNGLSDGRERGYIVGDDGNDYYGTRAIRGGDRDINVSLSMFFKDWAYLATELSNPALTSLVVKLGDVTFTFANGRYLVDGNNWPELSQTQMMLPLKMAFESVAIS